MARTISVASGKGGVGKTTFVANLGCALAKLGQRTVVVDADVAMANLGMIFGAHIVPITLQDVLLGEAEIFDAIYDGPYGVKVIPSGLSVYSYRRIDPERIKEVIDLIKKEFDFILVDVPAGIGDLAIAAMSATDEMIIVLTPDPAALADALKTKITAERLNVKPIGAVINMVRGLEGEAKEDEVVHVLELPVLGVIPEDMEIRKTFLMRKPVPVVARNPDAPAAHVFMKIASRLSGVRLKEEKKKGFSLKTFIKSILPLKRRGG